MIIQLCKFVVHGVHAFIWKISGLLVNACIELRLLCHNRLKLTFSTLSSKLAMKYSGQLLKRGSAKSILSSSSKKRFVRFLASPGFVKLMTSSTSIALPLFTSPRVVIFLCLYPNDRLPEGIPDNLSVVYDLVNPRTKVKVLNCFLSDGNISQYPDFGLNVQMLDQKCI